MLDNNNIQIAILEISNQNKAVLEFYFNSAGQNLFTLVSEDKAEAFITDYDYPGVKSHVAQITSETNKPVIILSVREQNIPSTVWLAKPLSANALTKSAEKIKKLISENSVSEPVTAEAEIVTTETTEVFVIESESTETAAPNISETAVRDNNRKIEKRLAMASTAALVSATAEATESSIDTNQTNESLDFDDISSFEFGEVQIEDDDEVVTESEVDAMLEVLIQVEEEKEIVNKIEEIELAEESKAKEVDVTTDEEDTSDLALDEDFIIHDDVEPSEENVYADTLEVTFDQLNSNSEKDIAFEKAQAINDFELKVIEPEIDPQDVDADTLEAALDELKINSKKYEESKKIEDITDIQLEVIEPESEPDNLSTDAFEATLDEFKTNSNKHIESDKKAEAITDIELAVIEPDQELDNVKTDTLEIVSDELGTTPNKHTESEEIEAIPEFELEVIEPESKIESENILDSDTDKNLEDLFNFELKTDEEIHKIVENIAEKNTELDDLSPLNPNEESQSEGDSITPIHSPSQNKQNDLTDLDGLLKEVSLETEEPLENVTPIKPIAANEESENISNIASFTSTEIKPAIDEINDTKPKVTIKEDENDLSDFNLQSLLNEVREEASHSSDDDNVTWNQITGKPNAYHQTDAEKRWLLLCGDNKIIKAAKEISNISFLPNNHLLEVVLQQVKSAKNSDLLYRIKYDDLIIVFDPSQQRIYCNVSITTDEYAEICYTEVEQKKIKVHDLDYSEIRLYRKKIQEHPDRTHSIEAFIWTTSLLTSRGRLPVDTDLTKNIGLKTWPNLTRVELLPHAMQIAAVLNKNPGNLLEVAEWISIEQKYIFGFYNAALSLGMLELDSAKIKKPSFGFKNNSAKNKSKERGFLGRLLKRLKS